ncbi:MAG: ABC transporter substrate-binding protein, partial [Gemmatimonadetes bacterium]|nr:ABC transporter substrate-binding protein [Gemmatimonadota bacterium]
MRAMTRRSLLRAGLTGCLVAPWWHAVRAFADRLTKSGVTDTEIILGTSAAFSGPSRGLGIELYRGAGAYFTHINQQGGIAGRTVQVKAYDDGYQPGPSVKNTMKLMLDDQVFLLFGYVGTPTVTRVLPILKKFQDQNILLFFPFTGAQPQREPPYGTFAFNLRASYRQETAGLVDNFVRINRRRIAVFYQADAYGRSGWAGVRSALKKHGEQIVGEATYRRGERFTGTMRKQVEILKEAKPEAVICIGAYAACAAFARDAVDLGLQVPFANLSFVGSENLLKLLTEGRDDSQRYTQWLVNSQVVPSYEDTSIPAVQEYRNLMSRYAPQLPAELLQDPYTPFDHSFVSLEGFLN